MSGFNFLFCVVSILCTSLLIGESFHPNKCVESERKALLKFKDTISHGSDEFMSWEDEDCCKWEGVLCNNLTGHVTSLYLSDFGFACKLDASICELEHLTSLNLDDNYIRGEIPKCIGLLGKMKELHLNGNELVGVVPLSLGNLSNLETLDLGENSYLSVNDLEWLSNLSNLRHLDLSLVNLTLVVDWLSLISKIPHLSELNLNNCMLQNVTQKSISHVNSSISLKSLSLRGNSLNSFILTWVANVCKVLTSLDVSFNSLQQRIPYEVGNMTFLQTLDLSYNELHGSIPNSFKSMCQLNGLILNSNKFSGKLNDNIQQLCCVNNSLEYLDLSDNPFTSGSLPNLSRFSSLLVLSLHNTNLVGLVPKWFFHFLVTLDLSHNNLSAVDIIDDANPPAMSELDLSFNQISGPFPYGIGKLSSLRSLSLFRNKLNGMINETHLSNLSELKLLAVSQNSLSFNMSSHWIPPFKLEKLFASSCQLGPEFPVWLKHQTELYELDISNTGISDSLPKWFGNTMAFLNVSYNKLNGPLPKSPPRTEDEYVSGVVYVGDFRFNNLSGSLPAFHQLNDLFLSNNMFTGSLSSFCKSVSPALVNLDLSSNFLEGKLSDCWRKFPSLKFLNLANNNLSGKVPNSIGALRQIESLHLNNNNFSGEIPSLKLCHKLKLIDMGDNNLHGTIPMWIGRHLPGLIVLRLRANKFQGNIPTNLCNLSFLQVLDLSINNITGEIPRCFGELRALSNTTVSSDSFQHFSSFTDVTFNDDEILTWKGSNREYAKNLRFMKMVDLSCNQLSGEIPKSITKLVALVGFNLSRNNLTGFIPDNIGHMKNLESLDLSKNHFCGRIPISISNLTFLAYLNLSSNNLEGRIPLSTQLQSFNRSSYMENNGLCGPPLINHCPEDTISPTGRDEKHVTDEDEDEDKLISFGFFVSLGLGFIIGFWGVCGTLVIKTSWRHAYFKFFKKINDWTNR